MFQREFHITNITCDACVKLSTMALKDIPGMMSVSVDQKTGKVVIHADREVSKEEINKSLQEVDKITDL